MGRNSHRHPNSKNDSNQKDKKKKNAVCDAGPVLRRRPTNDKTKGKKEKYDDDKSFRLQVELDGKRTIREIVGDGNCLFRSLSDQLFGDYGHMYHSVVREAICNYMGGQKEFFQQFLVLDGNENSSADATSYEHYIQQMRQDGEWGGNVELIAASKLVQRNILVFQPGGAFLVNAPEETATTGEDLLVSYHDNGHYNSVWIEGRKTMLLKPGELTKVNGIGKKKEEEEEEESSVTQHDGLPKTAAKTADDCIINATNAEEEESLLNTNHSKKTKDSTPKRNDLCSCGSSLKYKKCCLARQKQQHRLQKFKQKHMQDYTFIAMQIDEKEETVINMEGDFKVIKI